MELSFKVRKSGRYVSNRSLEYESLDFLCVYIYVCMHECIVIIIIIMITYLYSTTSKKLLRGTLDVITQDHDESDAEKGHHNLRQQTQKLNDRC